MRFVLLYLKMLWLLVVSACLVCSARWKWFRNALAMFLPVCQGWSLLAEDMNRNGAADAMEEMIHVATNTTTSLATSDLTLRETIGSFGFFAFAVVVAVATLLLSVRIVLLFQVRPRLGLAFLSAAFVFFMMIPQLNGRSHWKAHFELLVVIFSLLAATECVRAQHGVKSAAWEKTVFVVARNMALAAFVWATMVRSTLRET
jgi:hypothetical protein